VEKQGKLGALPKFLVPQKCYSRLGWLTDIDKIRRISGVRRDLAFSNIETTEPRDFTQKAAVPHGLGAQLLTPSSPQPSQTSHLIPALVGLADF